MWNVYLLYYYCNSVTSIAAGDLKAVIIQFAFSSIFPRPLISGLHRTGLQRTLTMVSIECHAV